MIIARVYTESVSFCGEVCHSVMEPEFTAYQDSPHARVSCVHCHIGPGATWFVKSKLSGVYQVYATVMNRYARPIATPIAQPASCRRDVRAMSLAANVPRLRGAGHPSLFVRPGKFTLDHPNVAEGWRRRPQSGADGRPRLIPKVSSSSTRSISKKCGAKQRARLVIKTDHFCSALAIGKIDRHRWRAAWRVSPTRIVLTPVAGSIRGGRIELRVFCRYAIRQALFTLVEVKIIRELFQ